MRGFDPYSTSHISKLRDSISDAYNDLEPFRLNALVMLEEITGPFYGKRGRRQGAVNLAELQLNILLQFLVPTNLMAMVTSSDPSLRPYELNLQAAIIDLMRIINLEEELEMTVFNALLSIGRMKVGITEGDEASIFKAGMPFVECISSSNTFHDTDAQRMSQRSFIGDYWSMTLREAQANESFDEKLRMELRPADDAPGNPMGGKDHKLSELTKERGPLDDPMEKRVPLIDVYLPHEKLMITMAQEERPMFPLRVVEWTGPANGPYHDLCFLKLPDNTMPLTPMETMMQLHRDVKQAFEKIIRQLHRQKTVNYARGAAGQDAERTVSASDGETIFVNDPESVNEKKFGGPDSASVATSLMLKQLFSYLGGNLDTAGGLATQADTLGQEQLLAGGSSRRLQRMQEKVRRFLGPVVTDLAEYLLRDPLLNMPFSRQIEGTPQMVQGVLTPESIQGDISQFKISVNPYSMTSESPQRDLQILMQFVQTFEQVPSFKAQGGVISAKYFTERFAELTNSPQLRRLVMFMDESGGKDTGASKAPSTTRTYKRVNQGPANSEEQMMQSLLSKASSGQAA